MIIKLCGMRDEDNIKAASKTDIDMMGFIFYPKSPRYVNQISARGGFYPDYSSFSISNLDNKISRVGVFVDDMPQNIITRVYNYHLDYVQLHGDESPVMCKNLISTLVPDIAPNIKIIKAISIDSIDDLEKCEQYNGIVNLFLFDTKSKEYGGSGKRFDWSVLQEYGGNTPFLLSGGIDLENIKDIKKITHPKFIGVDINSRFEIKPGVKDIEKVKAFTDELKK